MACTRQAHGIIASLSTVLISILLLALERSVLSHYQHRLAKHSTAWPPHQQHPSEVKPLALVPEDLDTTPTKLVVACGALGLIAGIVGFFRTTSPAKSGERLDSFNEKPRRPYFTLTWTLLTTLLGLASFIYASIAQSKSSTFRYTDFTSGDQTFTRESWACQLATYYPDDEWSALTETCKEAVSAFPKQYLSMVLILIFLVHSGQQDGC